MPTDERRGYAVVTADGYFVGMWREHETAEKVLNRSVSAKGERIVPYIPADTIKLLEAQRDALKEALREALPWIENQGKGEDGVYSARVLARHIVSILNDSNADR